MTHNRKPDVLPVEGASIAEALEALDRLPSLMLISASGAARVLSPIRSALERAAADGEAWRVIEEWCAAGAGRDGYVMAPGTPDGPWKALADAPEIFPRHFLGTTRLEALQAAAEWVKAQALPAPPKGSTP